MIISLFNWNPLQMHPCCQHCPHLLYFLQSNMFYYFVFLFAILLQRERERPFKKNWSGLTRFRGYNCNCLRLEILLKCWKKTFQEENVSFKIVIWSCLKNHLCLDCWCFRRLDLYTVLTSHTTTHRAWTSCVESGSPLLSPHTYRYRSHIGLHYESTECAFQVCPFSLL